MAFIAEDDKLLKDKQLEDPAAGGNALVGSEGAPIGGATVTGGTGGMSGGPSSNPAWTNIQNYLQANQGDTGSAQKLTEQTNKVLGAEESNLQSKATEAKNLGKAQVDSTLGKDQASKILDSAAQNYSWGGNQNQAYSQSIKQLQDAKNAQYSGPTSFAYGVSADTQKYGQDIGNNDAYSQIMKSIYEQSAGKPLTRGGLDLQNQLDVSNEGLAKARQDALSRYAGLSDTVNKTVSETDAALKGFGDQFRANQNETNQYLTGIGNQLRGDVSNAEAAARASYENDALQKEWWLKELVDDHQKWWNDSNYNPQELANALRNPNEGRVDAIWGVLGGPGVYQPRANEYSNILENWYGGEQAKYANTADAEKRKWNALAEALGLTDKYSQGFNAVRRL